MARQALIKLRRGTGLPANNALQEGELAIDIAAKKLYSANSNGNAFTLSGDQYNLAQTGNASHGIVTLTVDNTNLSNDSILITGGTDVVVAGNSSVINVNSTSTLATVTGRGATTSTAVGFGNTTATGFINATTTIHSGGYITAGADVDITGEVNAASAAIVGAATVGTTLGVTGVITAGNDVDITGEVNAASAAIVGAATVGTTLGVTGVITAGNDVDVSGEVNAATLAVVGDAAFGEDVTISGNLTVSGTTTTISSTVVNINDNLIKLAANQTATDADAVDTGIYMTFDESDTQKYSGMFRDQSHSNKAFVFVEGITGEPGTTVTYTAGNLAHIEAIIDGGTY